MIFGKKLFIITTFFLLLSGGLFYFATLKKQIKIISENPKSKNTSTSILRSIEVEGNNDSKDGKKDVTEKDKKNVDTKVGMSGKQKETEEIVNEEEVKETIKEEENNINDKKIVIKNKLVSWGFTKSSGRKIDTIILHSSYDALGDNPYDTDGLITEYKQYGVAPHYLIDRKGNIYRLVEDKNIAWHAGVSKVPDGRTNVNNFSIGVEIMNTKTDKYTEKQYQAVQQLIDYLKKEYTIKYILGHNDIAPGRKTDPWNFNWRKIIR